MARRTEGLGADSKVPLRGLIDLFKELDPQAKDTLRSAFVDAEDLQNYFSKSVPERQTRRKISGRIDTITVTVQSTLLGGFVKWNRLPDKRIAFYEIQVSDNNIFSSFETYTQVDTFLALENLRTTKFVRVRGVTASGLTGLFSATATIRPKISAPKVYSLDFYQRYGSGSDPSLGKKLVYSGGNVFSGDAHPKFYSIFSDNFYLDRDIGGAIIWGSVSSRLKQFADSGTVPWDRVRFKVNGIARSDIYSPHWTINYDEEDFHVNEKFYSRAMTFYGKGGFTSSFGPYAVTLPNGLAGQGPNDPHQVIKQEPADASFYWTSPMSGISASRFDEGQLPESDSLDPAHEVHSLGIDEGQKTEWLIFRDFRFNIPSGTPITGIEAKIKRRQFSRFNDPLSKDSGKLPASGSIRKYTLINGASFLGIPEGAFPILEDANIGRFAFNAQSPPNVLLTSRTSNIAPLGQAMGFGTEFTVTGWALTSTLTTTVRPIVGIRSGAQQGFFVSRASGANPNALQFRAGSRQLLSTNFFSASNQWFHFACTCRRTPNTNNLTLTIYKNGILAGTSGGAATATSLWTENNFGVADIFEDAGGEFGFSWLGGITNIGVFNKVLLTNEILAIANEGGRADLRQNFGDYESSKDLVHYFLLLPDQADIRDEAVHLVDSTGTIRTDLDDKSILDESWPRLSQFFYTDLRQYGFLPIALSEGIPHDNHTAIGYQTYGSNTDLWGKSSWTPEEVNSFYFGLALRAINEPSNGYAGYAYVDHAKITVYTVPASSRDVQIDVEVAAANEFYLQREVYGGICNIIEMGEKLSNA